MINDFSGDPIAKLLSNLQLLLTRLLDQKKKKLQEMKGYNTLITKWNIWVGKNIFKTVFFSAA